MEKIATEVMQQLRFDKRITLPEITQQFTTNCIPPAHKCHSYLQKSHAVNAYAST